ncbi:hypothetical protein Ancab_038962 [Ancistrocladus abbreviatus]
MGKKKRNVASRTKSSVVLSPASGDGDRGIQAKDSKLESLLIQPGCLDEASSSWNYEQIKSQCDKAISALSEGNQTKALKIMKEASHRFENSALIHECQGIIWMGMALCMEDPDAKQRRLRNAIDSARKAVNLSPNSIVFSYVYAKMLFELASDSKEYEEVVQECERGLAIENPTDPAKESLQKESQPKLSTAAERVGCVNGQLWLLIQSANEASISKWMKTLGIGSEDDSRIIPVGRLTEDPMELGLVPATRRPTEIEIKIEKATKTPEERRKEIEANVAAARLVQQKSEREAQSTNDESKGNPGLISLEGNVNSAERKDQLVTLELIFSSLKDGIACGVLSEALSFAVDKVAWHKLVQVKLYYHVIILLASLRVEIGYR